MVKAEQFFQAEYLAHKRKPLLTSINGKEFVVPYVYVRNALDEKSALADFQDDFFDAQQKDLSLYEENKIEPREIDWTDGKNKYTFFVPFALKDKNLSNSAIITAIFKKAERKYKKAASLAQNLRQAYPNSKKSYGVSAADIKSMRKEYRAFLWNKTKDKTKYGALLLGNFALKGIKAGARELKFGAHKMVELTPDRVKKMVKRYALATLVGGATLTGGIYALKTSSLPKQKSIENIVAAIPKKISEAKESLPQQKVVQEKISVQKIADEPKTKQEIAAHNKQIFLDNINEIKATLCFMENFAANTYLDGNDVPTIGYGSTYFIDEKGEGDWSTSKVKKGMKISMREADVQKERYLKFKVLPQMIKDVKVPLSPEEMIAASSFAYNVGPGGFKRSKFLKAMNNGVKGKNLARCMFDAKKNNPGLVKRNLFAYYIMQKKVKVADLLDMRTEGCYSLELHDCCATKDNAVKWEKDGLATFREDNIVANIAKAKKARSSVIGKCKLVKEVLPDKVVRAILNNAKQQKNLNVALLQTNLER